MNSEVSGMAPDAAPEPAGGALDHAARLWRPALALLACGLAMTLVPQGLGPAGGWVLGLACALLAWPRGDVAEGKPRQADAGSSAASARMMAGRIVPVWQRQLEASKAEAEKGVGGLLQSFSGISDSLARAAEQAEQSTPHLMAGATDQALDQHASTIEALVQPMRAMRGERDAMFSALQDCARQLAEMATLAKSVHEVSRHTHLLAFNASIEANRAGHDGSGFTVLAQEVRTLAGRSAEASDRINALVRAMLERVEGLRRENELKRVADDELDMVARQRARAVAAALVTEMSTTLRGSRELRESALRIRGELDQIFLGFQFQDRLNQMLDVVGRDMGRFTEWMDANRQATPADAAQWLADLENTYTMEEQRTHHHGNVQIERSAAVEFF
jgi:methyl-accepting chemotaxis protein